MTLILLQGLWAAEKHDPADPRERRLAGCLGQRFLLELAVVAEFFVPGVEALF